MGNLREESVVAFLDAVCYAGEAHRRGSSWAEEAGIVAVVRARWRGCRLDLLIWYLITSAFRNEDKTKAPPLVRPSDPRNNGHFIGVEGKDQRLLLCCFDAKVVSTLRICYLFTKAHVALSFPFCEEIVRNSTLFAETSLSLCCCSLF